MIRVVRKFAFFLCLVLMVSSICFAEQTPASTTTMELSLKDYHWSYAESAPDREYGPMTGMRLSFKNQNNETKNYWQVLYENTNHNTHYAGSLQLAGNPAYDTTTSNKITTSEITYGVPISKDKTQFVYVGYGHRDWDRNVNAGTDVIRGVTYNVADNLEKYSWSYIPVGYRKEYKLDEKSNIALDFSLRFMFDGKMDQYTSSWDPAHYTLGNKPGYKLELPYTYKIDTAWSFVARPWFEYSGIKQSNVVVTTQNGVPNGAQIEPSSMNHQYGLDIGVTYSF